MSKTAEEYWKEFPKHKPAKDADIAEAMREYAELYAQQRVAELEKENLLLKSELSKRLKEMLSIRSVKISELEKENERLRLHIAHGDDKILRCAFCGDEYPSGTPSAHHELLTAHVKVCKKHPYREISNSFDDYLKSLCRSAGVPDDEINLPSEHGNDRLRWAALYELKRIKDFNELLEENERLKANYEGMKFHCKTLTDINVSNMAFDQADSQWKKQHKVEEGENFIDWYMKNHAAELRSFEQDKRKLEQSNKELVEENKRLKEELRPIEAPYAVKGTFTKEVVPDNKITGPVVGVEDDTPFNDAR